MIGIAVGLGYATLSEWVIHKHVLHGPGKKKGTFWSFHFHTHHRASRLNQMHDEEFTRPFWEEQARRREVLGLVGLAAIHLPLFPVAPFFTATVCGSALRYYHLHKKAHMDIEWGRKHLPWHYDHHMAPNQDANWGVTWDGWDRLFGTREVYLGTEREERDFKRRQQRLDQPA